MNRVLDYSVETILVAMIVVSVYDFIRLYFYGDEDVILRSVHGLIIGILLLLGSFYIYKKTEKSLFVVHICLFLFISGLLNIVNNAKVLHEHRNNV
jgi:hypothetical protein